MAALRGCGRSRLRSLKSASRSGRNVRSHIQHAVPTPGERCGRSPCLCPCLAGSFDPTKWSPHRCSRCSFQPPPSHALHSCSQSLFWCMSSSTAAFSSVVPSRPCFVFTRFETTGGGRFCARLMKNGRSGCLGASLSSTATQREVVAFPFHLGVCRFHALTTPQACGPWARP